MGSYINAATDPSLLGETEHISTLDVPTEIPRVGVTLEAIWKPFAGTDANAFTGRTAGELGVERVPSRVRRSAP